MMITDIVFVHWPIKMQKNTTNTVAGLCHVKLNELCQDKVSIRHVFTLQPCVDSFVFQQRAVSSPARFLFDEQQNRLRQEGDFVNSGVNFGVNSKIRLDDARGLLLAFLHSTPKNYTTCKKKKNLWKQARKIYR